ncbi:MAG: SDR family oxidoreductase [Bacteroidota bacterium]
MIVSILGCGWYGRALATALLEEGVAVKGSTSSPDKLAELSALGIQPYVVNLPDTAQPGFFDTDILVVSIPPKFRKGESDAFISKIQSIITAIQHYGIKHVIYTSSTGVYGENQGAVNELTDPVPDDLSGKLLLEAETLFQSQTNFLTTIIRFGGLVGPGRHPGRFFAGKKGIPNGLGPVNLVHLDDIVAITQSIIAQTAWGQVFNACAPDHSTRADFYTRATQLAGLELPEFKQELLNDKTVDSIKLGPLLNYQFKHNKWIDYVFD